MNTKKEINNRIDNMDRNFQNLINSNALTINAIENLAVNSIEEVTSIINSHIEDLLSSKVNEKELIIKKNSNGKKEDII